MRKRRRTVSTRTNGGRRDSKSTLFKFTGEDLRAREAQQEARQVNVQPVHSPSCEEESDDPAT